MSNKRYYWLKLDENFFEDDTVQYLLEQKNGAEYVIFYLKLCCASLEDDGTLIRYVGNRLIPYDAGSLSKKFDTNIDTVTNAMSFFTEFGLIKQMDNGELFMSQIEEMIGSETDSAKRMRKVRAREKAKALTSGDYEVIDDESQDDNSSSTNDNNDNKESTILNNDVTDDAQCDREVSQSDKGASQCASDVQKSDTEYRDRDRYRDRVRDRHNREMSQNYVPQSGSSNDDLVVEYFYSDIKANDDRKDEKYVRSAIDKYGWEEVLVTMITLKEDQGAVINTFKYVETAIERRHSYYLEKKDDFEWMTNSRMERIRDNWVRDMIDGNI